MCCRAPPEVHRCALVQDDLLYESLTVEETLYYAAMLRLPRHLSREDKKTRVSTVIKALGIESCKDTIIGKSSSVRLLLGYSALPVSSWVQRVACFTHQVLQTC